MGLRDWIVDEKLVIDHVSIKDQLSGLYIMSLSSPVSNFPIQVSIVGAC